MRNLFLWTITGHVLTKADAVRLWLRGDRKAARVAWRWMANMPTTADILKARTDLQRPHVRASLRKLYREELERAWYRACAHPGDGKAMRDVSLSLHALEVAEEGFAAE